MENILLSPIGNKNFQAKMYFFFVCMGRVFNRMTEQPMHFVDEP